ncbi:MAG TPA: DNA repair protein RadC [Longimicrobium sp.]|nr:DNA repair protein RadC [Longimicrobium sp.]
MPALAVPVESVCGVVKIKEWPATDRPRERLCTLGPQSLSSRELLALLIESGRPAADGRPARSAMDLAGDLLAWALQGEEEEAGEEPEGKRRRDTQPLRRIMMARSSQLCSVFGIGPARAAKILAAMELGRRAVQEVRRDAPRFTCARHVFEHVHVPMRDLRHEEFHVVLLNAQGELMRIEKVAQGTVDTCHVQPRDVFGPALREGAHSVVAVHNHPSGEPRPSDEDRRLTQQLEAVARMLEIRLLDHVIVGEQRYWSFSEQKQMTSGW